MKEVPGSLFRSEALDHYRLGLRHEGAPLRLAPLWTRYAFGLMCAVIVSASTLALFANVDQYATGPAIIRHQDRTVVSAKAAGVVAAVEAVPGQRVEAGQLLVKLDDSLGTGGGEAGRGDFTLAGGSSNRENQPPCLEAVGSSVEHELSARRTRELSFLRAPRAGLISDVRVRAGQYIQPGDIMLTIVPIAASFSVVAVIPGHFRPQIQLGAPLRLELAGYRYAFQHASVEAASDEVIGPTEVRRYLGPEIADTIPAVGPAILVRADLPANTFLADGKEYRYYDGMLGTVEIRVRSENVIVGLLPWLRHLKGGGSW
ncbi:MAG: HlyD family efflux transporter periplasmic adaptor subunit [Pseudomonadota bacterium]